MIGNVWNQLLSETELEGVYVCVSVQIKECELLFVTVQLNSDSLQLHHWERLKRRWRGGCCVFSIKET